MAGVVIRVKGVLFGRSGTMEPARLRHVHVDGEVVGCVGVFDGIFDGIWW